MCKYMLCVLVCSLFGCETISIPPKVAIMASLPYSIIPSTDGHGSPGTGGTAFNTNFPYNAVGGVSSANCPALQGNVIIPRATNIPTSGNVYYVSGSGSDSNAGTVASPWLTIQHALSSATTGSTVVLRGSSAGTPSTGCYTAAQGVYRGPGNNAVTFPSFPVTLQSYPGEQVWIKGSKLFASGTNSWTQNGTSNVWYHTLTASGDGYQQPSNNYSNGGDARDLGLPRGNLANYVDMVFVNGLQLLCNAASGTSVSASSVTGAGQFAVHYDGSGNATFYIWCWDNINPNNANVEVAVRGTWGNISGGSTVCGLGWSQFIAGYVSYAISANGGTNITFKNNAVAWMGYGGLVTQQSNAFILNNIFAFNGGQGVYSGGTSNKLIQGNYFAYNNHKNWNKGYDASGIKFIACVYYITVANNLFDRNNAPPCWFDTCGAGDNWGGGTCANGAMSTIVSNIFTNNSPDAINIEWSDHFIIANNLIIGNVTDYGHGSILIASAQSIQIWNNTFSNNSISSTFAFNEGGRTNVAAITMENNIISVDAGVKTAVTSMVSINVSGVITAFSNNAYYRSNSSVPSTINTWVSGYGTNGIGQDGGTNPYFVGGSDPTLPSYYA